MWLERTDRRATRFLQLYDTVDLVRIAAKLAELNCKGPEVLTELDRVGEKIRWSSQRSLPQIIVGMLQQRSLSANWLLDNPRPKGHKSIGLYLSSEYVRWTQRSQTHRRQAPTEEQMKNLQDLDISQLCTLLQRYWDAVQLQLFAQLQCTVNSVLSLCFRRLQSKT